MKASKGKNLKVNIVCKTHKYTLQIRRLKRLARETAAYVRVKKGELSFCFVNNAQMRRLNKQYKHRDRFTDVLAFPLSDVPGNKKYRPRVLYGDIIISLDQAQINAKQFNTSFMHEVMLYVIHGILHVVGYTDVRRKDRTQMEKKQQHILEAFKKNILMHKVKE